MTKPLVIGFMGYAGVGKTSASRIFQSIAPDDIEIVSFAGPLKKAVQELFLLEDHQLYGTKAQKEAIDPRWCKSPRQLLQIIGTACLRDMIDPQFHVKRMARFIRASTSKVIIIDDIRFEDEADLVNHFGQSFLIERPGFPEEAIRHKSENPPKHLASGYYILNNQEGLELFNIQLLRPSSHIKYLIEGALDGYNQTKC